ncbi:MAG: prepilin peptidase [Agathobacter sp.]|nr:prepilin peptidase [Agathobacter sp.]
MPAFVTILLYSIIFLYGIIIGSFLNVCIYRIPKKESLIPSSHCMSCGSKLRWYDLFPVFSFILLKGRCRYCKAKVSWQYPMIEMLNGILYVIVFMANGISLISVVYCLMTSALIVITVIDERTFEIPVGLNYFLLVLGIGMTCLDYQNWKTHLIGILAISLPLYLLFVLSNGKAIGGGDVKLMGAAGLILGWKTIILAFFAGCIIASVIHLCRMKFSHAEKVLAMGPYLSVGIFISALWGNDFITWYLSLLGI